MILGDSGVGKTSIFNRFFFKKFDSQSLGSVGASFRSTTMEIASKTITDVEKKIARIKKMRAQGKDDIDFR